MVWHEHKRRQLKQPTKLKNDVLIYKWKMLTGSAPNPLCLFSISCCRVFTDVDDETLGRWQRAMGKNSFLFFLPQYLVSCCCCGCDTFFFSKIMFFDMWWKSRDTASSFVCVLTSSSSLPTVDYRWHVLCLNLIHVHLEFIRKIRFSLLRSLV